MRAFLLVALLLAVALCGCKKRDKERPPPEVVPIPEAEKERGIQACDAYVERLCRCAESHPELKEKCALVQARPEALTSALRAAADPDNEPRVRWRIQITAREIMASRFEEDNKLDLATCPRSEE